MALGRSSSLPGSLQGEMRDLGLAHGSSLFEDYVAEDLGHCI